MSKHLKHKPAAPWHWDGEDPLDLANRKRVVAQSSKPEPEPEPETWDIDGLGR